MRSAELDGLRGLAALAVFFSHLVGLVADTGNWAVRPSPWHVLWDGRTAVMLFFVLSGYVLTLPYTGSRARLLEPVSFWVRRITRLYPAYWFALALSLLLRALVLDNNHLAMLNDGAASIWAEPLNAKILLRQFVMVAPGVDSNGLDPVIWSLIVEMKASLLFPAIVWVVRRTPHWALAVVLLAALYFPGANPQGHATITLLGSLQFFLGGSYLARYRGTLRGWIGRRGLWGKVTLALAALLLYGNASFFGDRGRLTCTLAGVGSALTILLFLELRPLARVATVGPSRFLGVVSYSFYLLHLPILLAVADWLYPATHSLLLCGAVALALMLAVSRLVWAQVEIPGQELGRRWAPRLDGWVLGLLRSVRGA